MSSNICCLISIIIVEILKYFFWRRIKSRIIITCLICANLQFLITEILILGTFKVSVQASSLIIAPLIAYVCYVLSLIVVGTNLSVKNIFPFSKKSFLYAKKEIGVTTYTSTMEELTYRGVIEYALMQITENILLSVVISTILFFCAHLKKKVPIIQLLDILLFSIIISVFFATTKNLVSVIIIHIIRNALVILQKRITIITSKNRFTHIANKTIRKKD